MPRSILVAVDIENQSAAGAKRRVQAVCHAAAFLSERLGTGIDLVYVEDLKRFSHDQLEPSRIRFWHSQNQEALNELSKQFSVPVRLSIKRGHPAEQILDAARTCELVIMGTHGRKGLPRLIVGSITEEVIRNSKRPVMVIGPAAQERNRDFTRMKEVTVLVATDLGKNSRAAERYAFSLARRIGARVVLFHCLWESINAVLVNAAFSGMLAYRLDEIIAESRDDAVDILKKKAGFFRARNVPCDYKIEEKATPSACGIYQEAEEGYSMIVTGTRGRNALLSSFFGSTARETIMSASIPVIAVHSG